MKPISTSSAAAWTAVRRTGISVDGSGRDGRVPRGTPRGWAGWGRLAGRLREAEVGRVDLGRVEAGCFDFGPAEAGCVDLGRGEAGRVDLVRGEAGRDVLEPAEARGDLRVAPASLALAFTVSIAPPFAGRSGRLLLRRWGRERGSALSRSEGRSSVIEKR